MLVPGRLGGPVTALPFETLRLIAGGAARPGGAEAGGLGRGMSEEADVERRGADVGPVPLTVRGGPLALGGGAAVVAAGVFSAPAFLLIQRLSSGS